MNTKRAYIYSFSTHGGMRKYILSLLRVKQKDLCAACGCNLTVSGYQIDHKRYELDITLNDLQLLCGACHGRKTGIKGINGKTAILPL